MSLNCNEINEILSELDIKGSFIQQIIQPGYDSLALYCYKNGTSTTVLICLGAGACRIHETRKKIPKNDKPLRFMEFLRSRVKGCRINSCEQLGLERIIKMELSNSEETFIMFIRLWSGAANIIVTDNDLNILDVFYRRPKKGEVSGGKFELPQPRDTTRDTSHFEIRSFDELEKLNSDIENIQTSQFTQTTQPTQTSQSTQTAPEQGEKQAPLSQTQKPLTFNQKVDLWYSEHAESLSREAILEQAEKYFHSKHSRMEAAIKKLEAKRTSFLTSEQWKHQGDLILTYGHLIDGTSSFLECVDYETDTTMRILIDPKKSAQENATLYYEKYKKAVSGLTDLEHDIKRAKNELLDLEFAYEAIQKEPNPIKMQQMFRKQTKPKQQIAKKHPGLSYVIDDWQLLVGRTADENDELLRRHVRGADMWLHTRDWPGGYVFIKARPNKSIPLDVLLDAGNLALYHSKGRKAHTADLYYTQVKYLRRAKNGPKGTVLPTQEKNLTITLDEDRLRKIEECQIND